MTARQHPPLTPLQLEVLEFERSTWKYPAAKATAVHTWFGGMDMTRYYLILRQALPTAAAERYDPTHVRRCRRIRGDQAARLGRRPFPGTR